MMQRRRGFTLIELMVVLAVAAILLLAGVPALQGYLRSQRLALAADAFFHGAHRTRALALRRGGQADMMPLRSSNWARGWDVSHDSGTHREIIMTQPALPEDITVTFKKNGEKLSFWADGQANQANTWSFNDGLQTRHVVINIAGRIRQCRVLVGDKC